MLISIHPLNPQPRLLQQVVDCLKDGGVVIFPTDTIYGIGCDIYQEKAVERIARIKGIDPKKANFSFICRDLSHLSDYTKGISNPVFRLLKNSLPGPFTFVLEASKEVPRIFKNKKNTVGIRVPEHKICQEILGRLDHPLMSTSIPMHEDVEYYTDPYVIEEEMRHLVDMVVDGGIGNMIASTVVDCTKQPPEILREGAGQLEF